MKKNMISVTVVFLLPYCLNAQNLLDKLDRATNSVNNASNRVDNASNSATNASNTGGKILSLFSKKNKGEKVEKDSGKTVISISNIQLSALKNLNSTIENVDGVSGTKMKYDSEKSTISVVHTGSTEELLEVLQKKSKDVFADKNIKGFDDGEINITLK